MQVNYITGKTKTNSEDQNKFQKVSLDLIPRRRFNWNASHIVFQWKRATEQTHQEEKLERRSLCLTAILLSCE